MDKSVSNLTVHTLKDNEEGYFLLISLQDPRIPVRQFYTPNSYDFKA